VLLTTVANLPPVSLIVIDIGGKFAAGDVDTGGKFATNINNISSISSKFAAGVIDTSGEPGLPNISANFRKKF
jgi:hypothetical protein